MSSRWKQIKSPPPPYLHAFRTTTEHGLHVIVAARQNGSRFEAWSILDHGTFLKTIQREAEAANLPEVVEAMRSICERYDDRGEPVADGPASYHYLDAQHKMRGPVSREELFEALDTGVLRWESQVWDERAATGRWASVDQAIGFAQA